MERISIEQVADMMNWPLRGLQIAARESKLPFCIVVNETGNRCRYLINPHALREWAGSLTFDQFFGTEFFNKGEVKRNED